ncbi:MAG: hypothetical protein AAF517_24685, partial [Planctomycetota bacterium]
MSEQQSKLEADRQLLADAQAKGGLATLGAYLKLSGPGWLQSALTLGGGSLSSSLYLGVLAGFSLLWLQPLAMILGIVMLSAIGYVTMSTGERPFQAINKHVNPVLGWGWALASLLANMVWALPQYSLATGVVQQNLGANVEFLQGESGKTTIVSVILLISVVITWSYGGKGWGVKIYEMFLKLVVALIVACFIGVVYKLSVAEDGSLDWGQVWGGFVPNFGAIFTPQEAFDPALAQVGEGFKQYWHDTIVRDQVDVVISAAATAVGINMTFLFPYSILSRGWGKEFRGLSKFDLSTGMLIPFLIATSCVVLASASQFHGKPAPGLLDDNVKPSGGAVAGFHTNLAKRIVFEHKEKYPSVKALKGALKSDVLKAVNPDEAAAQTAVETEVVAANAAALEGLEGQKRAEKV